MIPPLKTTAAMCFALGAVVGALKAPTVVGKYPWDWVPMWDGKRESVLLNAANIVSITPMFDPNTPADKLKNRKLSISKFVWSMELPVRSTKTLMSFSRVFVTRNSRRAL